MVVVVCARNKTDRLSYRQTYPVLGRKSVANNIMANSRTYTPFDDINYYNRKYVRRLLTFFVLVIRFVVYFISILLVVVAIMAVRGGRNSSLKDSAD